MGNNAASDIEKARLCTNFILLKNCAKYYLEPEPEPRPESETETNRNFSKVGTGTATNHYGS